LTLQQLAQKHSKANNAKNRKLNSFEAGDSAAATEFPPISRELDRGLYQALDRNFFLADSGTSTQSFNITNGPAVIFFIVTSNGFLSFCCYNRNGIQYK
jgi:hypothetical protein